MDGINFTSAADYSGNRRPVAQQGVVTVTRIIARRRLYYPILVRDISLIEADSKIKRIWLCERAWVRFKDVAGSPSGLWTDLAPSELQARLDGYGFVEFRKGSYMAWRHVRAAWVSLHRDAKGRTGSRMTLSLDGVPEERAVSRRKMRQIREGIQLLPNVDHHSDILT